MKRSVLVLILFITIIPAWSNPIVPNLISRFWFEQENVLEIELSAFVGTFQTAEIIYLDAEDSLTIQVNPNAVTVQQINVPQSVNTPASGFFTIRIPQLYEETVHWGTGLENDLSPLNGTQCAVQILYSNLDGDNVYGWAKDVSPAVCGPNYCSARFTYRVECTDLSGLPVAGVSVYNSQSAGGIFINPAITNSAGIATGELYPMKTQIWVNNPITNEIAFNTQFFAEPGALIPFSVQLPVSVEENIVSIPAGKLNLYPSVINSGGDRSIRISYDTKLTGKAELVLYDLKGRHLAEKVYDQNEIEWQLPKLSSGIYFVRLTHQGKALGTAKLIILK